MTEPVRLAKRLAEMLPCSRRDAELYIEGGWVRVDGKIVDEPHFRVQDQVIELLPDATPAPLEPVTLVMNKPEGYRALGGENSAQALLTTENRSPNDQTGIQLLYRHLSKQQPVTALETDACGLIVFTQDWRTKRRLEEEARLIEHEFTVDVQGTISKNGLKLLNHGLKHDGFPIQPMKVSWQNETRLRFALKGYQPGLIADMCDQVGLEVIAMKRLRIGSVPMAGLAPGQWRFLTAKDRF